ncbi:MAG: hypothetical protein PF481_05965 [Bacteroidales bacterium]|jgi:hypothetical protein|nr:hypothetical protein [Bacteroidales bacterium]
MKQRLIICCLVLFSATSTFSQSLGAGAMYNVQTESIGFEVRALIPVAFVHFVPQVALYPSFNNVHELHLGMSAHINVWQRKFNWYVLGNISYNTWYNYEVSPMPDAERNNMLFDVGAGIILNRCYRPFLEYRYNPVWQEATVRIGVLYNFGCLSKRKKSRGGYHSTGKENAVSCPGK